MEHNKKRLSLPSPFLYYLGRYQLEKKTKGSEEKADIFHMYVFLISTQRKERIINFSLNGS